MPASASAAAGAGAGERGQVMLGQHEQLATLVTADVPCHHLAFVQQTQFITTGTHAEGLAYELRRRGIAIAVEGDAGMRTDDSRHHFIAVEGNGGQRPQQSTFLVKTIDGPFAGGLMDPHVGHLIAPVNCQSEVVFKARQLIGPAGQGIVFHIAHAPFDNALRFRIAAGEAIGCTQK